MDDPFRTPDGTPVPTVTADEMSAVDRVAVDEFDLALLSMMENAGRGLADRSTAGPDDRVVVLAGSGGNGGGGLAAARHLHNRGAEVSVVLDRPADDLAGAAARQWRTVDRAGVETTVAGPLPEADVLLDALIGYGLDGAPRGTAAGLIRATADVDGTVVSLDVPSGTNATTGERPAAAVTPDRTVTLALPKTGLRAGDGDLFCVDLAIPDAVFAGAGVDYERPFGTAPSVRLERPS
jgi:NAD(P)H-hydrate epimerase